MEKEATCDLVEIFDHLKWKFSLVAFTVIEIVIAFFAIIGNYLVFIAFLREKKLRHKINFYIISQAFADFGVGLIAIPFGIAVVIWGSQDPNVLPPLCNRLLCLVPISIPLAFSNISIYSLVLISVKRLGVLTLNSPIPKPKTNKNIAKEICLCWVTGISIGFFPLIWNDKYDDTCIVHDIMNKNFVIFRFVFAVLIPSIILGYVYYKIYRIIVTQSQKKLVLRNSGLDLKPNESNKMAKDVRATLTIAIIVVSFWITWIPLQCMYFATVICKDCVPKPLMAFNICFIHLHSALNPMIYAYRMRDIRKAVLKLFGRESSEEVTSACSESVSKARHCAL